MQYISTKTLASDLIAGKKTKIHFDAKNKMVQVYNVGNKQYPNPDVFGFDAGWCASHPQTVVFTVR